MDIVSRVKNILVTPQTEWPVIASEPGDPPQLFTGYVIILAAIPAVAQFLGLLIVGRGFIPIGTLILLAIIMYIVLVISPGVVAFIVSKLAPQLGAQDDLNSTVKLAVYAFTPFWLAGAFYLLLFISPTLVWLVWLVGAVYGIYLLWLGAPILAKTAPDKTPIFVGAAAVIAVVVTWVLLYIATRIAFGF